MLTHLAESYFPDSSVSVFRDRWKGTYPSDLVFQVYREDGICRFHLVPRQRAPTPDYLLVRLHEEAKTTVITPLFGGTLNTNFLDITMTQVHLEDLWYLLANAFRRPHSYNLEEFWDARVLVHSQPTRWRTVRQILQPS